MLTYLQRKSRLPFGASARVGELTGIPASSLTTILKRALRNRRAEVAFASFMVPNTTVEDAFGEPGIESLRRAPVRKAHARAGAR